jgi:hypothetical protein
MTSETGEKAEAQNLGEQMVVAADAIRAAVLTLLREGEVHPQLILMAVARVTGELAASAALAADRDLETVLAELAEVVRQAGREQAEAIELRGCRWPGARSRWNATR